MKKSIMKKIKILLLLGLLFNSNLTFSQNVITWYRIMGESTLPTFDPTLTTNVVRFGYYNVNPNVQSDQAVWFPGATNWQAANWFGSGGGATTINYNIQVANGACNAAVLELSPELFGAAHSDVATLNAAALANYPNIGAQVGDLVDWAAWQMAVKIASITGGAVKAKGPQYWINKPIFVEKFANDFLIDGNYSFIRFLQNPVPAPDSPPIPYFARKYNGTTNDVPADWNASVTTKLSANNTSQAQALQMANVSFTIKNLIFSFAGNVNQRQTNKAFDLGPSTGAYYLNIRTNGLRGDIHLRFATKTIIENCLSDNNQRLGCWRVDYGNWIGATPVNSASNQTTFLSCRSAAAANCNDPLTGFLDQAYIRIDGAYGTVIKDCIFEGSGSVDGVVFNYAGNVNARDLTLINTHYETACGSIGVPFRQNSTNGVDIHGALVNVSMYGGIVTIDKVYSQHASYFVIIRPPIPGLPINSPNPLSGVNPYPNISISNISWFLPCASPAQHSGRYFLSLWPSSWNFTNNEGGLYSNGTTNALANWFYTGALPNLPIGVTVQNAPLPCNGPGCGNNRYFYNSVPR